MVIPSTELPDNELVIHTPIHLRSIKLLDYKPLCPDELPMGDKKKTIFSSVFDQYSDFYIKNNPFFSKKIEKIKK
jgi:hypothetical protein